MGSGGLGGLAAKNELESKIAELRSSLGGLESSLVDAGGRLTPSGERALSAGLKKQPSRRSSRRVLPEQPGPYGGRRAGDEYRRESNCANKGPNAFKKGIRAERGETKSCSDEVNSDCNVQALAFCKEKWCSTTVNAGSLQGSLGSDSPETSSSESDSCERPCFKTGRPASYSKKVARRMDDNRGGQGDTSGNRKVLKEGKVSGRMEGMKGASATGVRQLVKDNSNCWDSEDKKGQRVGDALCPGAKGNAKGGKPSTRIDRQRRCDSKSKVDCSPSVTPDISNNDSNTTSIDFSMSDSDSDTQAVPTIDVIDHDAESVRGGGEKMGGGYKKSEVNDAERIMNFGFIPNAELSSDDEEVTSENSNSKTSNKSNNKNNNYDNNNNGNREEDSKLKTMEIIDLEELETSSSLPGGDLPERETKQNVTRSKDIRRLTGAVALGEAMKDARDVGDHVDELRDAERTIADLEYRNLRLTDEVEALQRNVTLLQNDRLVAEHKSLEVDKIELEWSNRVQEAQYERDEIQRKLDRFRTKYRSKLRAHNVWIEELKAENCLCLKERDDTILELQEKLKAAGKSTPDSSALEQLAADNTPNKKQTSKQDVSTPSCSSHIAVIVELSTKVSKQDEQINQYKREIQERDDLICRLKLRLRDNPINGASSELCSVSNGKTPSSQDSATLSTAQVTSVNKEDAAETLSSRVRSKSRLSAKPPNGAKSFIKRFINNTDKKNDQDARKEDGVGGGTTEKKTPLEEEEVAVKTQEGGGVAEKKQEGGVVVAKKQEGGGVAAKRQEASEVTVKKQEDGGVAVKK